MILTTDEERDGDVLNDVHGLDKGWFNQAPNRPQLRVMPIRKSRIFLAENGNFFNKIMHIDATIRLKHAIFDASLRYSDVT
ncbi:hypothetical protein G6321_00045915 [Bradyrhizobium barranii subsp. barranii]|uniref:Uncharacterized protein n=1 Tax=Bradyrhizobium barranii subsp. barranii TaxID=2823807 RepID=A0A7Z0QAX2_9BRAD|nr:hypothetical protein [Bradyrhizobium barranii]UGX92892.1 hypothetical protein G6321_00045915 [Bradyrhizobium barranii subsp. barranii]